MVVFQISVCKQTYFSICATKKTPTSSFLLNVSAFNYLLIQIAIDFNSSPYTCKLIPENTTPTQSFLDIAKSLISSGFEKTPEVNFLRPHKTSYL